MGKTDPKGKLVTLAVAANERKTIVKDLRHFWLLPMLPMQVMDTTLVHAIKRATKSGRPSWCAIENNKVRTFDRMVYDYALNNCEHVAFRDCTAMRQMAECGDKIERASSYPTESVAIVYEPEMC